MTPEAKARIEIDTRLAQAGWLVQDMKQLNLGAIDSARIILEFQVIVPTWG